MATPGQIRASLSTHTSTTSYKMQQKLQPQYPLESFASAARDICDMAFYSNAEKNDPNWLSQCSTSPYCERYTPVPSPRAMTTDVAQQVNRIPGQTQADRCGGPQSSMHPRYTSAAQAPTLSSAMTVVAQQANRLHSEIEFSWKGGESVRKEEGCGESGTASDGRYTRKRLYL